MTHLPIVVVWVFTLSLATVVAQPTSLSPEGPTGADPTPEGPTETNNNGQNPVIGTPSPGAEDSELQECIAFNDIKQYSRYHLLQQGYDLQADGYYFCSSTAPERYKCKCSSSTICYVKEDPFGRDLGECGCCRGWIWAVLGFLMLAILIGLIFCLYACLCRGRWWCDGHPKHPEALVPRRNPAVVLPSTTPVPASLFRGYRPNDFESGLPPGVPQERPRSRSTAAGANQTRSRSAAGGARRTSTRNGGGTAEEMSPLTGGGSSGNGGGDGPTSPSSPSSGPSSPATGSGAGGGQERRRRSRPNSSNPGGNRSGSRGSRRSSNPGSPAGSPGTGPTPRRVGSGLLGPSSPTNTTTRAAGRASSGSPRENLDGAIQAAGSVPPPPVRPPPAPQPEREDEA